ncbi:MAG TPA: SulP family inorganic anion transporter, partial [Acidimicrobiia bacterium]
MRGTRPEGPEWLEAAGDHDRSFRLHPPRPAVPGVAALSRWRQTLRGDVVAGVAVASYLIPQCMAYARLAGLEPVHGLWAALPALGVYAFLGTSSRLSVGPESASALLVGSAVFSLSPDAGARPAVAAALALAVAAVALVAWAVRLGFLADLLSKPVLAGYMAGVAVSMIVSQLPNLTGIETTRRETVARMVDIARGVSDLRPAPLLLGVAIVALLVVLRRFPLIPGPLLAVLAATVATVAFDLEDRGVSTVGKVPGGLPPLALPDLPASMWAGVFGAAVGIAIVVFSDNVLTARAFAARAGDRIDADQEFLALAAANAGAGLAGGFPVSSSGSRTALGDAAGARSQLASLVAAIALLVVLLTGGPLLESFPQAALGGLVVFAG